MTARIKPKRGRPTNASRINATAYPRNIRDGASTPIAIRTRLQLLAAERGLTKADIAAAWSTHPDDLIAFAERHRVNLDWLICGKLAGLLDTVRNQPELPPAVSPELLKAQLREFVRVLATIDQDKLPTVPWCGPS
jgi:hypothetical protein